LLQERVAALRRNLLMFDLLLLPGCVGPGWQTHTTIHNICLRLADLV